MGKSKKVLVGKTKVGRGVFAAKAFSATKRIGRVRGETIEDADYGSDYCMHFGDGCVLEPAPPFRFLNHSCDPNCELIIWERDELQDWEMHLYALRSIEPGEELTIDYGWSADMEVPCACGSDVCRGWIVSLDELPAIEGLSM